MELLLNLAWLLLALPAYWLWRGCKTLPPGRRFNSLQGLLALGFALVILFPVVSATDDMCAMCAEMEESPATKRSVCHKISEKPSTWKSHSQPGLPVTANSLLLNHEHWNHPLAHYFLIPDVPQATQIARAPPYLV